MGDQAEDADVAVARLGAGRRAVARVGAGTARQVSPCRDERGTRAVLEPAAAVLEGVQHEDVAIERGASGAVPEADLGLAQPARVGEETVAVEIGQRAGDDELVDHAGSIEAAAPEAAELDRMVDELVVVGGDVLVASLSADARRSSVVATSQPSGRPTSASACGRPRGLRRAGRRRCR